MKIIYIDESGTIGPKVKEPYFIITAIIFDNEKALKRVKNLVRRTKVQIGNPVELHAKDMNTAQKQQFINKLTSVADYRVAYIAIEKSKLSSRLYQHKNVTYNYLFGLLIERVLGIVKEDVRIVCDNRTTKVTSADSLCDYVRTKAYGDWKFPYDISIEQVESHTFLCLQAADILANSIFARYNIGVRHLYDLHGEHYIAKIRFPYKVFSIKGD